MPASAQTNWPKSSWRYGSNSTNRVQRLRGGRPRIPLAGRTALVVDDGIASGTTAEAACRAARILGAQRIVLGVPVAPTHAVTALGRVAEEIVCTETPVWMPAISQWYGDFSPTSDDEVAVLLERAAVRSNKLSCAR